MIEIKKIDRIVALDFIFKFHYSKIMPRLTKYYLGGYINNKLVGVVTLGWGVRPIHTIKNLFPTLSSADYYEIGKLCMDDAMPRNSESQFLSAMFRWAAKNTKAKLIYTWADGVLGKPGYVYQSANMWYGGFIWTDLYLTSEGEKIHPRTSQGITNRQQKKEKSIKVGHRPTKNFLKRNNWLHYKGKQFRYCHFLCSRVEEQKLLKSSTVQWNRTQYPKHKDLSWQVQNFDSGEWSSCNIPQYNSAVSNDNNVTVKKNLVKVKTYEIAKKFFTLE